MISRSFCLAIMKKITKKRDLGALNEELNPKMEFMRKIEQDKPLWKNFTLVNGGEIDQRQRSRLMNADVTRADVCWHSNEWCVGVWGAWEHVRLGGGACRFVGMCYCKTEPSSGAWERVQCRMKLIRVILFFIFYFFFKIVQSINLCIQFWQGDW